MSYLYHQREPRLTFGEPRAAAPAPMAGVLSGPTPIVRGTRGEYVVNNAPGGATFSNWRFATGRLTFARGGNNNVNSWAGTMVQSGTISVNVTAGGNTRTLTRAVTVTPRQWTENAAPIPLTREGHGRLPIAPRDKRPGLNSRDAGLGTSATVGPHTFEAKVVKDGPNTGFNYTDRPPVTWTTRAFTNEALYDPSHPFYRAHDPMRRGIPLPGGRLQIGFIQKNVEAHEGIISPPYGAPRGYASHHQALLNYLRAHPINAAVERDVSHISKEASANYGNRINAFVVKQVRAGLAASEPHPNNVYAGPMYFEYPFITPRRLRLNVRGGPGQLSVNNRAGGTKWSSSKPLVATVDVRGAVRPVAPGNTVIRVTNKDGDIDEITVTVDP